MVGLEGFCFVLEDSSVVGNGTMRRGPGRALAQISRRSSNGSCGNKIIVDDVHIEIFDEALVKVEMCKVNYLTMA